MTVTPLRMLTIGGSDAAAACGIDPHRSRVMLWLEKTGRVERPETEAMRWGRLLQAVVLDVLLEDGWALESPVHDIYADPERPWLVGHPDHFGVAPDEAIEDPHRWLIEVKTAGYWSHKHNGAVPVEYAAQCQHYLHLTGLDRALLVTLVGGQRLELHTIERDEDAIRTMLALEADFYGYLIRDEPLAPDASQSAREALAVLYPEANAGRVVRAAPDDEVVVRELRARREQLATVKDQVRELENTLKASMGDAECLRSRHDVDLVRWANTTRTELNRAALKEHMPALYDEYCDTTTTRRFTLL
jgi:putative phage-type endonuclease